MARSMESQVGFSWEAGTPWNQLRQEGNMLDKDVSRLSPLIRVHINMLGRYSVVEPIRYKR